MTPASSSRRVWPYALAGVATAVVLAYLFTPRPAPTLPAPTAVAVPAEATPEQVHAFCGHCHAYPEPGTVPRREWRREVRGGYDFLAASSLSLDYPPYEGVVSYYEKRAPDTLPLPPSRSAPPEACPVRFERVGVPGPRGPAPQRVSNVNLVHLFDARRLDVLTCDVTAGDVSVYQPYADPPDWRGLARLDAPAHAEVVDLDGDGVKDVIVADLGNFFPTDAKCGRVVWLRGKADGTFTPITLLKGVGRVADVRAADFNGDGKTDLVAAVFGWRETGETLYLENKTADWGHPRFVPRVVDDRHGPIHVPVADLDGDGKPDFVALISQEHETVVAFRNDGRGNFTKKALYTAPHPAYGSSGIQLVDLDGDGDLDVLYTNGDVLQPPYLLRPDHGVQWLENDGRLNFTHHPLAPLCGAARAVAADVNGDGRLDVLAVSFLPANHFPQREALALDAVLLLEQTAPGRFVRHCLERRACDSLTCAAGDVFGDGRTHLVTGTFPLTGAAGGYPLVVWKNLGPPAPRP